MDKIKVNLSYSNYSTLIHDAETFNFIKINGEVNKNRFYNEVIKSLYMAFYRKNEDVKSFYKKELSKHIFDNKCVDELVNCISKDINQTNSDFKNQYHEFSILIRPSKEYYEIYETILETHLQNDSISNYFRNIFLQYCSLDQDDRELLLFEKQFLNINNAINNKKEIKIKIGDSYHRFIPYHVVKTKEKLFNYVVGFLINKENKKRISSFHLYKLNNIIETNKYYSFTDEDIEKLDELILKGPQYRAEHFTEACIQLTKNGQKMWKLLYLNRPIPSKIEDDKYYFDCSINQLEQYFIRFGKDAYVLYPTNLRNRIIHFYKDALNSFNKDKKSTTKN